MDLRDRRGAYPLMRRRQDEEFGLMAMAAVMQTSSRYDSLLAKLIVSGDDLPSVLKRSRRALSEFRIEGFAAPDLLISLLTRVFQCDLPAMLKSIWLTCWNLPKQMRYFPA